MDMHRTIEKPEGTGNPRNIVLMLVGGALVVMGGALLLGAGLVVLEVIEDPASVKLVALILEEMEGEGNALYGNLDGARFEIGIGEPLRTLLFLVLVVWLLGMLVSILKTLVLTGRQLLSAGGSPER